MVEVAKPSTLRAIEADRDAITARLGVSTSLDALVVQPMRLAPTASASAAADPQSSTQDNASDGANRNSSAGGRSTSRRDGASSAWRQGASGRRSAGDLTV